MKKCKVFSVIFVVVLHTLTFTVLISDDMLPVGVEHSADTSSDPQFMSASQMSSLSHLGIPQQDFNSALNFSKMPEQLELLKQQVEISLR